MNHSSLLTPHQDPWINASYGYVTQVVRALVHAGHEVHRGWIDPCSPRDATILYSDTRTPDELSALVWDEESGWRAGIFESGRQGIRTVLRNARHLGGGVLPAPGEVVTRLCDATERPRPYYRSHADLCDGFDERLAVFTAVSTTV